MRGVRAGDRGSATLEITVLAPVMLLLVFTVVQAGLWFYARSLALTAAQEGAEAARTNRSGPAAGIGRAQAFLDRSAADSLHDTSVTSAGSTATRMRIVVTGRSLSVLPGVPGLPVEQAAEAPIERFTAEAP